MEEEATSSIGYVVVAKVSDIAVGTMKAVTVGAQEILVARVNGKFYAADNICPHMGANLSLGKLDGTVVTCPRHASKFDLVDGRIIRWTDWTGIKASVSKLFRTPRPIIVYPVKIEGENVLAKINQ